MTKAHINSDCEAHTDVTHLCVNFFDEWIEKAQQAENRKNNNIDCDQQDVFI
jgi:hypothetical protein